MVWLGVSQPTVQIFPELKFAMKPYSTCLMKLMCFITCLPHQMILASLLISRHFITLSRENNLNGKKKLKALLAMRFVDIERHGWFRSQLESQLSHLLPITETDVPLAANCCY